jgi:hypothetical protein
MLESPQLGSQFAIGLVTATNEPAGFQIQEIGDSAGQEGLDGQEGRDGWKGRRGGRGRRGGTGWGGKDGRATLHHT